MKYIWIFLFSQLVWSADKNTQQIHDYTDSALESICKDHTKPANCKTETEKLIKKIMQFYYENVSGEVGWVYVGMIYENRWIERYLDIKIPASKIAIDKTLVEYNYPEPEEVKVLGIVNLREGHIQSIDGTWTNRYIIGEICEGQMIKIISLKRVSPVGDTSDSYKKKEFDGFWWAKVSGDIGKECD
ncbi:MAG: hypothetical protein OXB86_00095 [Bdellovibrionales bacterium]|nr:hypothetical protein [Bdellovibrionales bacterium]